MTKNSGKFLLQAAMCQNGRAGSVKRQEVNLFGFLMRMHKVVGMNTGWILLADTLAGAMMLLSITGVLLWTRMRGSRLTLAGLGLTSIGLAVFFTVQSL